ncbi:hypothetical protein DL93DRAFT_2085945 [Clavulina sp. PMI_390]|nr:hypothetical protein DL93DRAFT_2085945 [Clavulina sp. PMI_390]
MRAATSVALIVLLAAPAFAAPISSTPAEEEPSFGTQIISSAAGGAASGAVGNLLSEIESFFKRGLDERSTGALTNIVKQAQTLSAADKAAVKTALVNKISTLQTPSKRLSIADAAGKALGGLANEGAKTAVGGLLTDIENLFRRDDAELEARAPLSATSLGGSLVSSAAGGTASGLVGNLLGEIESLFRRDDAELEARSPLSATSLGGSIVSSAAGGAASGLVGNLLGEIESFFKRDVGILFPGGSVPIIPVIHEPLPIEARAPLSATSLGGSLVSSAAGGAASGLVGNLLGEIESLFRRGVADVHDEGLYVKRDASSITSIIKQAQTLSASDKATVKTALMNKIGTLQGKRQVTSTSTGGTGTGTGSSIFGPSPLLTTPQGVRPMTSLPPDEIASILGLSRRSEEFKINELD